MISPRLHVLMPVSRPQNLPVIMDFYLTKMETHPFELRLLLGVQGPAKDPKGMRKINELMGMVPGGWFITQADDTVHHPSLFRRIAEVSAANPQAGMIVFSGQRSKGPDPVILRATPENMKPCHVCGSQVAYKKEFVGGRKFDFERRGGECDGWFIRDRFRESPGAFVFVDEPIAWFGSMEWDRAK